MIALGQAVFGQNLFGVRIASALSVGLSVLLAYRLAERMWGDWRISFTCAVVFMSMALIAAGSGYANLDPQFALWMNPAAQSAAQSFVMAHSSRSADGALYGSARTGG